MREGSFAKEAGGGLLHIQAFLMIRVVLEEGFTREQVFLELIDVFPLRFISGDGYDGINEEEGPFDGLSFLPVVSQSIMDAALEVFHLQQMSLVLHA